MPKTPDWTETLARMVETMSSHPDWRKCMGTPLGNDLPVRAAKVAHELMHEMMSDEPGLRRVIRLQDDYLKLMGAWMQRHGVLEKFIKEYPHAQDVLTEKNLVSGVDESG